MVGDSVSQGNSKELAVAGWLVVIKKTESRSTKTQSFIIKEEIDKNVPN